MNVTFRLPSEDLEKLFVKESTAAGFDGLKGHRSVGGLRASIYNAFPEEGVNALVEFMREFETDKGGRVQFLRSRPSAVPGPACGAPSAAADGAVAVSAVAAPPWSWPVRRRLLVVDRRLLRAGRSVRAPAASDVHDVRRVAVHSSHVSASGNAGRCGRPRARARRDRPEPRSRGARSTIWRSRSTSRRATGSMPKLTRSACGSRARPFAAAGGEHAERLQQRSDQHGVREIRPAPTGTSSRYRSSRASASHTASGGDSSARA